MLAKSNTHVFLVDDSSTQMSETLKVQRRSQRRVKFYLSENIKVQIFSKRKNLYGYCADLCAKGISVFVKKKHAIRCERDDLVQVVVESREGKSSPLNAKFVGFSEQQIEDTHYWRLSFSFIKNETDEIDRVREIGQQVWLDEFMEPLLTITDVFKINSLSHGRIKAFGKDGLVFHALNQDHVFLPGIVYPIKVQLPVGSDFQCRAKLIEVDYDESSKKIVGVLKFEKIDLVAKEEIAQSCILGSKEATPAALREIGMFVGAIESSAVEMTYPSSQDEYQEMMDLRFKTYQGIGKYLESQSSEELWDEFDDYSRHIIFRVREKIIGSIRVVFCHKDVNKSEHVKWGVKIPSKIKKAGFVEVSRACINEEYRATDIFAGLIRQTIRLAVENKVRYVIVSCNPHLVSTYKSIGGKVVGKQFEAFGRNDCSLIVFDIPRITKTSKGSFIAFHLTSYPLFKWMSEKNSLSFLTTLPNLFFHRALSPIVKRIVRMMMYRKFKRMINSGQV